MDIITENWTAREACKVAGIDEQHLRNFRCEFRIMLGKPVGVRKSWRFSALDVAELAVTQALREGGFRAEAAFTVAHQHLRPVLHDALVHGKSVGDFDQGLIQRAFNLDAVVARVIAKLNKPQRRVKAKATSSAATPDEAARAQ